ncbi:hypothetical protein ABGB12_06860 [Actinocorallia sp. B10E7]|uniref:hypothetical protein n=1 Tax=Actinocorallia sp. B10E7 TaxID=3153558 RepID=UPI00325E1441
MRKTLAVLTAALLVPLASAPAEARPSDKVCGWSDAAMKYDKTMLVRKNGVLLPAKKHPNGAVKGRWTKTVGNRDDNDGFLWKPYGPTRTRALAKNVTVCLRVLVDDEMTLRKTGLKGFRKAVAGKPDAARWNLRFNKKGEVVKVIEAWDH